MASGKSIVLLIVGIAILAVGFYFIMLWQNVDKLKDAYDVAILLCGGDTGCIQTQQASFGGDIDFLVDVYLYGGFGFIAGGAVCLILALKMLLKS